MPEEELLTIICDTARYNAKFLKENYPEVLEVCEEFGLVALNEWFVRYFLYSGLAEEEFGESVMVSFLLHTLAPQSTYLCVPILHGAVNSAYLTLRNFVEGVIDALYADVMLRGRSFEERINALRGVSLCKLINRLKDVIGEDTADKARRVWDEASNRLHAVVSKKGDGIIPLAVKYIEKYGGPPTYQAIPLPSKYELEDVDLDELKKLKECIILTKEVVEKVLKVWHEKVTARSV